MDDSLVFRILWDHWIHPRYLRNKKKAELILFNYTIRHHMHDDYGFFRKNNKWFTGIDFLERPYEKCELFSMFSTLAQELHIAFGLEQRRITKHARYHASFGHVSYVFKVRPLLNALDLSMHITDPYSPGYEQFPTRRQTWFMDWVLRT